MTAEPNTTAGVDVPARDALVIPTFRTATFKAWPKNENGGTADYMPPGDAFSCAFDTDAHFACYSVPSIERRLSDAAPAKLEDGVPMVLAVFDVDCAQCHAASGGTTPSAPDEWFEIERAKLARLVAEHPGGYAYRSRGGYRIVYAMPEAFVIRSGHDVTEWKRRYIEACAYLLSRFEIECDPRCFEWQRLFRLPRATRDPADGPENRETIGDPAKLGTFVCGYDAERDAPAVQRAAEREIAAAVPNPAWKPKLALLGLTPKRTAGARHGALLTAAARAKAHGLDAAGITEALEHANAACDPPKGAAELASIAQWVESRDEQRFECTDDGNALRLVSRFGAELRFCRALGWLVWSGTHWQPDAIGAVTERARLVARGIMAEASAALDRDTQRALTKWAMTSQSAASVSAMVRLAQSDARIAIMPEQLDSNPWLLNAQNCTIDLRVNDQNTIVTREHRREDLITRCLPVTFDDGATCLRFETFLEQALPDPEVRAYLHRFAGYASTGIIREHIFAIFWGAGRNGKSTFTNAIKGVLGPYYVQAPRELLLVQTGERHTTGTTDLLGARLTVASELPPNARLDVATVKTLSGGDPLKGRKMRCDNVEFAPTHKLVVLTNDLPRVPHTDAAAWGRIHLVPWTESFLGREDFTLGDSLRAEVPGVLAWLVRGCAEWQRMGLSPPAAVLAATATYREESDPLGEFFSEVCVFLSDGRVARKVLVERYRQWAKESGIKFPLSAKAFAMAVRDRIAKEHGADFNADGKVRLVTKYGPPVDAWCGMRLAEDLLDDVGDHARAPS